MKYNQFKKVKILIVAFIFATVAVALTLGNMILALVGILIGTLFLFLVKRKIKTVLVDERVKSISGYAARLTYVISTIFLAFLSLLFLLRDRGESLGIIFSYLVLLNLAIYSMSYKFYIKKYGDDNE